jgi:hypothetical protein
VEGQSPPAPCPRCGRPAEVTPIVVCFDPDFYVHAGLVGEPVKRPYSRYSASDDPVPVEVDVRVGKDWAGD